MGRNTLALIIAAGLFPATLWATDVDGPFRGRDDYYDRGDAPNGISAYPDGTLGRFPQVTHFNQYDYKNMWLGFYPTPWQPEEDLFGVDDDFHYPLPHCTETAFGMSFAQDECLQDSTDMCLRSPVALNACREVAFKIAYYRVHYEDAYLNILLDLNGDGDWGDVVYCDATQDSASEWAVENYPLGFSFPSAQFLDVPRFLVGPRPGPVWMRISLSGGPMPNTYPTEDTSIDSGETEDYPLLIGIIVPTTRSSWGLLKSRYR